MPATAHDGPVVHLARPHRPVLVAGTLRELIGPRHGLVELPLRLWWNPQHTFDLDQPTMLAWMYENVLREAIRVEELRSHLHGPTLQRVWPDLNLPRAVRAAWEARHPPLRHTASIPHLAGIPHPAVISPPAAGQLVAAMAAGTMTAVAPPAASKSPTSGMPMAAMAATPLTAVAPQGPERPRPADCPWRP